MTTTIDGTNVSTFAAGVTCTALNGGQLGGRRNILYNGAMNVAQRSTSVTGIGADGNYKTMDRWTLGVNDPSEQLGRATQTQTADGPSGFANCMKLDVTTADTSLAASQSFGINQKIEGQDVQYLKKGTADAEKATLSFYVKGTAATYIVEVRDDNSRFYSKTFNVTTSWNRIEMTIPADTTGAIDDDNTMGYQIIWWLQAGTDFTSGTLSTSWAASVNANRMVGCGNLFSSTSNELFFTGVQLELGDTATPFEHRSYGTELALCQRYYEIGGHANSQQFSGDVTNSNNYFATIYFNTTKKAAPTIANANANASSFGTGASTAGAQSLNSFRNHRTSTASAVGSFGDTWTATAEL